MEFSLGEFNIVCTNLEKSVSFYEEILNFKRIEKEATYAKFICADKCITLLAFAESKNEKLSYGKKAGFSLDILVDDLKQAAEYFKSKKVEFAVSYTKEQDFFAIYDPDGLIWEVVKRH